MDVDQIWRFRACARLLEGRASWGVSYDRDQLAHLWKAQRPPGKCLPHSGSMRSACERHIDRMRTGSGSKFSSAGLQVARIARPRKRRTRIFVDVLLRGLLGTDGLSPRERLSIRLGLASARFWIRLGPLAQSVARAIEKFGKHYTRAQDYQRARLVDLICNAFDAALNAGKQGEIDPVQAAEP